MARPVQDVRVYTIQDRRGDPRHTRPFIVRRSIDGRQRSTSFHTKREADRYRVELLKAVHAGESFELTTGEPTSWAPSTRDLQVHEWARRWLASQWSEWAPRTRVSNLEAISRLVALAVDDVDGAPARLRPYLNKSLAPDGPVDPDLEQFLGQRSLRVADLDAPVVADIARRLGLTIGGDLLAASTANRYRTTAHACLAAAVDVGLLPADPWPRRSLARSRRKATRVRRARDLRALPDPITMTLILDAMDGYRHGSQVYRVMTAVAYYAGLRPSEVVMLRVGALWLPASGWGRLDVNEADIDWDVPGEPKTGVRSVPIPPALVEILRTWLAHQNLTHPEALLFRTSKGTRPSFSNWGRALRRALVMVGAEPMRVYDCRHAAATTWLRAGVPLGETARRLGHSVDTLVSTYVSVMVGDEEIGNGRIDRALEIPEAIAKP